VEQLEDRITPCIDPLTGLPAHHGDSPVEGTPGLIDMYPGFVPSAEAGSHGPGTSSGSSTAGSPIPVPGYSSMPGATNVLYLNFGGDYVSSWLGYSPGTIPAYDIDGNPSAFSAQELTNIYKIWQIVAEDYSLFNVNVTTVDPRTVSGFSGRVSQIDIGGNGSWTGGTYGGIAQVGGFSSSSVTNPVRGFVFPANLGNGNVWYTAQATAHESGHNMSLWHQSAWSGTTKTAEYQSGPGDGTAPIMGNSYSRSRGMWWYGLSSQGSGSTYQNDLATVSSVLGYRTDEAGGTAGTSAPLTVSGNSVSASGVITTMTDVDVWSFTTDAGSVSFTVSAIQWDASHYSNLTPKIQLLDSGGGVVAGWQDPNTWTVSWSGSLAAGSYRLVVTSHGIYSTSQTSTNYGFNVGSYNISGTVATPANFVAAPTNLTATAVSGNQINLAWTDNATNETSYSIERSTDGVTWGALTTLGANSTASSDTTVVAGTTYYYRVRAFNGSTPSDYSNQASATTTTPPPNAPSNLVATTISATQIRLTWTDNSSNESAFYIERATYNRNGKLGSYAQIATVGPNTTTYNDYAVTSSKYYS
jgi:hypothetical protein